MSVPDHHKELAKHLREKFGEPFQVIVYRDNWGKRPIPIGQFGPTKRVFYSTIGTCDKTLDIPKGCFEFAAMGSHAWLPNAICTSIYYLKDRTIEEWPMICEDAVKQNVRSTYRRVIDRRPLGSIIALVT